MREKKADRGRAPQFIGIAVLIVYTAAALSLPLAAEVVLGKYTGAATSEACARVAKWDIQFGGGIDDGSVAFFHASHGTGASGSWKDFTVKNNGEVAAQITMEVRCVRTNAGRDVTASDAVLTANTSIVYQSQTGAGTGAGDTCVLPPGSTATFRLTVGIQNGTGTLLCRLFAAAVQVD